MNDCVATRRWHGQDLLQFGSRKANIDLVGISTNETECAMFDSLAYHVHEEIESGIKRWSMVLVRVP